MSRRGSSRPTRSTRPARLAAVSAGLVLAVAATTAGVGVDQAGAPTTTVAATPPEIVRHIGSDRFGRGTCGEKFEKPHRPMT